AARIALRGISSSDFGAALASAGDVNGDGYADFVITAGDGAHLYLGSASPSAADWNGRDATRRLDLPDPGSGGSGFGASVAGAGDIDGDGFADFIVGSRPGAHIYFGSAMPGPSDWSDGASSHRIDLTNPRSGGDYGRVVAGAGDVNGDGYADLLVGGGEFNPAVGTA